MIKKLARVGIILAVVSIAMLGVTGGWRISSADDEMPVLILAVLWAMLYITKPRRT